MRIGTDEIEKVHFDTGLPHDMPMIQGIFNSGTSKFKWNNNRNSTKTHFDNCKLIAEPEEAEERERMLKNSKDDPTFLLQQKPTSTQQMEPSLKWQQLRKYN